MTEDCTEKNIVRMEIIVIFANMNISFALIVEQRWIRSKTMTNYEKIKSMSVEDMAEMLLDESEAEE